MSKIKTVLGVLVAIALILALGLMGTEEMNHDKAVKAAHPEWAQFYED